MSGTDLLRLGVHPLSLDPPEGFGWVLPVLWGYARVSGPVPLNAGDGLFLYLLDGRGEAQWGDARRAYQPDCVLTAGKGEALTLYPDSAEKTEYLYLVLRNARQAFARIGPLRGLPPDNGLRQMLERFCHRTQAGPLDPYNASAQVFAILMEVCALADRERPAYRPLVRDAIEIIQQDCVSLAGVEELAGCLGVSKSHLIRVFRADTGISPGRYLQAVRLDNAKLLLQNREYTVETVALMMGYSSANYFCKVFRGAFGESPGQYRRAHRPAADPERMRRIRQLEDLMHL